MAEMSPLRRRIIEDTTVRNLSPATQRSYVHAVATFGCSFGHSPDTLDLEDVRALRKLPVVLGADEVVRFVEAVPSLKAHATLTTAYAVGLRASEAASVKVGNIDSSRMVIRVEQGKGGRDRYVMLSAQLLGILRSYWRMARPTYWLFPGRDPEHSVNATALHVPRPVSASASPCIHRGIASPPTGWRAALTSASSERCSATAA